MAINQIPGWDTLAAHNPASINGLTLDQLLPIMKEYGIEIDGHVDDVNNHVRMVDNIDVLRAPYAGNKKNVMLMGRTLINDGGQGLFYWDSTSVEDDDDGTIFKVSNIDIGRWKRLYQNEVRPEWYSDFDTCISTLDDREVTVVTDSGIDLAGGTVTVPENIHLKCNKGTLFSNGTLTINGSFEAGLYIVFGEDLIINGIYSYFNTPQIQNMTNLRKITGNRNQFCQVLGYYEPGDGGGGEFHWDETSIEADNMGTIIQVSGVTVGRWKRVYSDAVNVRFFGARGDGITDDTAAIQNTIHSVSMSSLISPTPNYPMDILGLRYNNCNYSTGTIVRWASGFGIWSSSIWYCVTGGTTASEAPDIIDSDIDDQIIDNSVIWKMVDFGIIDTPEIIIPSGHYMINTQGQLDMDKGGYIGGILILNPITLKFLSNAIFEAFPISGINSSTIINIRNADRVTIIGGHFIGDNLTHLSTKGSSQTGIKIIASSNVIIRDTIVSDITGDGYMIGFEWDRGISSQNIILDNVVADKCYRNGLYLAEANNVKIINSTFSNTFGVLPMAGIDIEPDVNKCENILISNNSFINNNTFDIVAGGGLGKSVNNLTIDGNVLYGGSVHGITLVGNDIAYPTNIIVNNNNITMLTNSVDAISLFKVKNSLISNNIIKSIDTTGFNIDNAIYLKYTENTNVVSCNIKGSGCAITVSNDNSNVEINSLIISDNYAGIIITSTNFNINLINNLITNCESSAISISSTDGMVSGNKISNCKLSAITGNVTNINFINNLINDFGTGASGYAGISVAPENCNFINNIFRSTIYNKKAIDIAWYSSTLPSVINGNSALYGTFIDVMSLAISDKVGVNFTIDS